MISLHFTNALELLDIVACDVDLFSFTWHCSVFYQPELESDIIINSVSFGLLQYWLSCFTLTVWETLHFSSEIETYFVQFLERKEKNTSFMQRHKYFFLLYEREMFLVMFSLPFNSAHVFPCNLFSLIYLWSYYFFSKNKWLKFCSSPQAKLVTVNEFSLVQKSFK